MAKITEFNFTKSDCYLLCDVIEYILGEKALRQEIFHSLGCNIGGGKKQLLKWYRAADRACAYHQEKDRFAEQETEILNASIIKDLDDWKKKGLSDKIGKLEK